jgi:hypothetical protein
MNNDTPNLTVAPDRPQNSVPIVVDKDGESIYINGNRYDYWELQIDVHRRPGQTLTRAFWDALFDNKLPFCRHGHRHADCGFCHKEKTDAEYRLKKEKKLEETRPQVTVNNQVVVNTPRPVVNNRFSIF